MQGTRTVNVFDTNGPIITVPTVPATKRAGPSGAPVTYAAVTASDAVDGDVSASVACESTPTAGLLRAQRSQSA